MARVVIPLNFNAFLEKAKLKDWRDKNDATMEINRHKMMVAISCHIF